MPGAFDESKTLRFVADTLGKIPRPTRKLEQTYTVEPLQDGERFVELRRVGDGQDVMVAYHAPAAGASRFGRAAGAGRHHERRRRTRRTRRARRTVAPARGRLYKALVDTKKAQSASMRFEAVARSRTDRALRHLNKDQSLDEARKTLIQTVEDVATEPAHRRTKWSASERGLLRSLENSLSEPASHRHRRSQQRHLAGRLAADVPAITTASRTCSRPTWCAWPKLYFKASNRTVGYYIPDATPGPHGGARRRPISTPLLKNYKSTRHRSAHGESFDPTPANIESRLSAQQARQWHEAGGAAEEDRQRHGRRPSSSCASATRATLAGKNAAAQFAGSLHRQRAPGARRGSSSPTRCRS